MNQEERLEAARLAADRRRRRQRRQRRRGRRTRRRLIWGMVTLAVLNLFAFVGLATTSESFLFHRVFAVDKVEHILFFLATSLVAVPVLARWVSPGLTAIGVLMAGLIIEIYQAYTPGRTADYMDFVADQLGLLIGYLIGLGILKFIRSRYGDADDGHGHARV